MPEQPVARPFTANRWIFPVLALFLAVSIFQGVRMGLDRREATEERYEAALASFGELEAGEPILNTRRFAYFANHDTPDDMKTILDDPNANDLAKIQAMEVLALILGRDAVPILIDQIESQSPPLSEKAASLLEEIQSSPGRTAPAF